MSQCPKSAWPAVKTMLHDADAVHAQYDKLLDARAIQLPDGARAPRRSAR